jgi:DNA-binding NarL/FixJ family response regulator
VKLSDKSRKILTLISAGHSYDQIVSLHSDYTYIDIFKSAEEALALASSSDSNYQHRLAKIKQNHPNAYEPWTPEQEEILKSMYKGGSPVKDIASALKRQPGAIISRIRKLGLD